MELLSNITEEQLEVIYFLNKCTKVDVSMRYKGVWSIDKKTGLVDIDGDFICKNEGLKDLKGVRFGVVTGGFDCSGNQLTSLEGAPQEVGGSFDCSNNKITSLGGAPQDVGAHFDCSYNKLTSLEGAPQEVGGSFDCSNNKITSLGGAPQDVGAHFDCSYNKLTSLEGAPQEVGGSFYCRYNKLTSLEGAPQKVGWNIFFSNNPISEETLELVWRTMCDKKIDYWTALVILKNNIGKNDFNKLSVGLDERLPKDAQKGISMLGRFGQFD